MKSQYIAEISSLPPIIKLSEALYVLLFMHDLATYFDPKMPPQNPLGFFYQFYKI